MDAGFVLGLIAVVSAVNLVFGVVNGIMAVKNYEALSAIRLAGIRSTIIPISE